MCRPTADGAGHTVQMQKTVSLKKKEEIYKRGVYVCFCVLIKPLQSGIHLLGGIGCLKMECSLCEDEQFHLFPSYKKQQNG